MSTHRYNSEEYYEQASQAFTGFNEIITSNATPIIDLKSIYGVSALRDRITTTGTAAVTTERGLYKVATGATAGSTAIFDSVEYGRYVAGFESTAGLGILTNGTPTVDEVARWGYFDEDNGFGWGLDIDGMFTFVRSGGNERVHRRIEWWDNDFDIDMDILNIYRIPFRWYGSGPARYEVSYTSADGRPKLRKLDVFTAADGEPITENPNLPLRVEVTNGTTASDFSLFVGGRQFFVQGIYNPNRRITSDYRVSTSVPDTDFVPLVSWQQKAGFESVSVKLEGVDVLTSGASIQFEVRVDGTLTGASFNAPVNIPASETALEFDKVATAISGGQCIFGGLAASGSGITAGASSATAPDLAIGKDVTLTLCARAIGGTATVTSVLKAREEW